MSLLPRQVEPVARRDSASIVHGAEQSLFPLIYPFEGDAEQSGTIWTSWPFEGDAEQSMSLYMYPFEGDAEQSMSLWIPFEDASE